MKRRSIIILAVVTTLLMLAVVVGVSILITRGVSARDEPSGIERFVARTARSLAVPRSAKTLKNPVPTTSEVLTEARAHFADHCAICHANDGSGETTIGQNLYPKAPDMRLPDTQQLTDGELYYTIHNGIRLTGMPAWGNADEDIDSWKLVHFIRHLPKITAEELEEMKRLNPKSPGEMDMNEMKMDATEKAPHVH